MKINNVNTLIDILNDNFFNFLIKENWIIEKQSDNFNYVDNLDVSTIKSKNKLKNKKHKIILPHESNDNIIDLDIIMEKYKRNNEIGKE
jgi:phage antirepressor YoqD-like protein